MNAENAIIETVGFSEIDARLAVQSTRLDNIETGLRDLGDQMDEQHDAIVAALEALTR